MLSVVSSTAEPLEARQMLAAHLSVDRSRLVFTDVAGGAASAAQRVMLRNTGDQPLTISSGRLLGTDAGRFAVSGSTFPRTLSPGSSTAVNVSFNPASPGPQGAALRLSSNDPDRPAVDVTLRGLGVRGTFGSNEPSLQWILDTFQLPVRTGDMNPAESTLDFPPAAPNDEIKAQLLVKAGFGPVTIEPIAVFSNAADPGMRVGFYKYPGSGSSIMRTELFTTPSTDVQTLNPRLTGTTQFDPGPDLFGLYSQWPAFDGRITTSEDFRNTWETRADHRREMRWYPLRSADGSVVANAFVLGNEEAANHDMQDGVFIVRNVKPLTTVAAPDGLKVTGVSAGRVDLAWADHSTVETAYKVERSVNGGAFATVATLGRNTTRYSNTGLAPSTKYTYRVRAVGGSITSGVSNTAAATTPAASGAQVYEAESAVRSGPVVATAQSGFTGSGFADFIASGGEFLQWTVNSASARTATLEFRYANGSSTDRPLELSVNGSVVSSRLSFATTGSWTNWRTVSITVALRAGANTVRLTSIGLSGANIDSLTVR